jgi:hypothetical protein
MITSQIGRPLVLCRRIGRRFAVQGIILCGSNEADVLAIGNNNQSVMTSRHGKVLLLGRTMRWIRGRTFDLGQCAPAACLLRRPLFRI